MAKKKQDGSGDGVLRQPAEAVFAKEIDALIKAEKQSQAMLENAFKGIGYEIE